MAAGLIPLHIFAGLGVMIFFFLRWAVREGEGKDPRWGLVGSPEPGSPIAAMGPRLFAVPTPRGLLLRSSSHCEAEWERTYRWRDVHAEVLDGAVHLHGPFGVINCRNRADSTAQESLRRMGPTTTTREEKP